MEDINMNNILLYDEPRFQMRCTYDFTCTGETFGILKKHNRNKKEEEDQLFEFFPLQVDENGVVIEDEEP